MLFIIASTNLLLSCGKEKEEVLPEQISKIEFLESEITLKIGQSDTLKVIHYPQNITKPIYKWINSNPDVLIVDEVGVIKALKAGKAEVTANLIDRGLKSKIIVNVLPVLPEKLTLEVSDKNLFIGDSISVKFSINPPNTTDIADFKIDWSSSDEKILTVSEGMVKGVAEGKAKVIGKIRGTNISHEIEMNIKPILPTSIEFNLESGQVEVGQFLEILFKVNPENTTHKDLIWTSSNNSIATVDNGMIIGIKEGEVVITAKAKSNSISKSIKIKVVPAKVILIELSETQRKLMIGESFKIIANVVPFEAKNKSITWTSSNNSVATVDQNGNVTAKAMGSVEIIATSNDNPKIVNVCYIDVVDLDHNINTYISSSSMVIINNNYTGSANFVLANYGHKTATVTRFEVLDGFGNILTSSNDRVDVTNNRQRIYSITFRNNYKPVVNFYFEIDGKKFQRTITMK
jgi:uncharacterized protein YjdB